MSISARMKLRMLGYLAVDGGRGDILEMGERQSGNWSAITRCLAEKKGFARDAR
jgi:hypothetical protein